MVAVCGSVDQLRAYDQTSARLPLERCKKTQWVHWLAFIAANRVVRLAEGKEISHICHNGRCLELAHLVAEDHQINSSRRYCKGKKCSEKHTATPSLHFCLLSLKKVIAYLKPMLLGCAPCFKSLVFSDIFLLTIFSHFCMKYSEM